MVGSTGRGDLVERDVCDFGRLVSNRPRRGTRAALTIDEIYAAWHEHARSGDVDQLLDLYAHDAVFESPLVPVLTEGKLHVCRGHAELRRFLEEGVRRRPNELVRWYRTGDYLTNRRLLVWEYPRETPDREQVDICEVMEIDAGKIQRHRIYWGWFGLAVLSSSERARRSLERVAAP